MLIILCPSLLVAQDSKKNVLLFLDVAAECASLEDDARLSDAITTRIPNAFIIRNDSVVPDWSVVWEKLEDETCQLTIFKSTARSKIQLGPKATEKEIDDAASRIAWISSFTVEEKEETPPAEKEEKSTQGGVETETKKEETKEEVEIKPKKTDEEESKEKKPEEVKKEKKTVETVQPKEIPEAHNSKLAYDHIDLSLSLVPGIEFYSNQAPHYRGVPALSLNLLGGSHIGLKGFEFGLLWNHKSEFVDGLQLALGANVSNGPLEGVQIALVNIAGQNSKGLQLGLANFTGDLKGLQVGLFNFGAQTNLQIGIINIAEKTDLSLGIFNLNWAYALRPVLWLSSDEKLTVGVQHGGANVKYSLLAGFYFPDEAIQIGGGLGYHSPGKLFFMGDLFAYQILFIGDNIWQLSLNLQAKASVGYRLSERFAVFLGASVNGTITSLPKAARIFPSANVIELDPVRKLYLWPNLHVGVSF